MERSDDHVDRERDVDIVADRALFPPPFEHAPESGELFFARFADHGAQLGVRDFGDDRAEEPEPADAGGECAHLAQRPSEVVAEVAGRDHRP
ncbi:MAG: hypothetical protein U0169_05120 [Polyangiaceae bacterium]